MSEANRRSLPSISLARAQQTQQEQIASYVKNHGSTSPLKLEHRREALSGGVYKIAFTVEQIQKSKKALIAESGKQRQKFIESSEDQLESVSDPESKKQFMDRMKSQLEDMDQTLSHQILQLDVTLASLTAHQMMIEGIALLVDCCSLRMPVKGKNSKKRGMARYSSATYAHDLAMYTSQMLDIIKEASNYKEPNEDKDTLSEEPLEADDEEILTDEEKEREKKRRSEKND